MSKKNNNPNKETVIANAPLADAPLGDAPAKSAVKGNNAKKKASNKSAKPNIFKRIGRVFKEMFSELKKVNWLTPKDTAKKLGTVLLVVLIFLLVVFFFDWGCSALLDLLIKPRA